MDSEVSAALRDLRDTFLAEMRLGFAGVHARQDVTNGRITKAEREMDRHDERLKNLQREVFNRRKNDTSDPDGESNGEGDGHSRSGDRRVSERDVRMVVAGGGASISVLLFFWKVLPVALNALKP